MNILKNPACQRELPTPSLILSFACSDSYIQAQIHMEKKKPWQFLVDMTFSDYSSYPWRRGITVNGWKKILPIFVNRLKGRLCVVVVLCHSRTKLLIRLLFWWTRKSFMFHVFLWWIKKNIAIKFTNEWSTVLNKIDFWFVYLIMILTLDLLTSMKNFPEKCRSEQLITKWRQAFPRRLDCYLSVHFFLS